MRSRRFWVQLALDDFGTGYSSLTLHAMRASGGHRQDRPRLSSPPWASISRSPDLVKALVELGHTLGLTVVAEGVEQAAQLEYLRSIGCERAQGYYYAKPLNAEDLEKFLRAAAPRAPRRHLTRVA